MLQRLHAVLDRQRVVPHGEFKDMKVALVADELTRSCLVHRCSLRNLTPKNFRLLLRTWKPDMLFVESAWQGSGNAWKYKIASYPNHPDRNNRLLVEVIEFARELGVPTVFWNKEDGVHFDRFANSAKHFDHIFTVDENCLPRYRKIARPEATVHTMMFSVEPKLHYFSGINSKYRRANFVGSYSQHIHDGRRALQHMLFEEAVSDLGLTVFDRNSHRKSANYRYPEHIPLEVRSAVPYGATAQIYKDYIVSLNVNTVQDSPTMFSRRLVEILGCGGLAVTTPALSVEQLFEPYCHVIHSKEEAQELFTRLARNGLSSDDREMMIAGAEFVAKHHTWPHRLRQTCAVVGIAA